MSASPRLLHLVRVSVVEVVPRSPPLHPDVGHVARPLPRLPQAHAAASLDQSCSRERGDTIGCKLLILGLKIQEPKLLQLVYAVLYWELIGPTWLK